MPSGHGAEPLKRIEICLPSPGVGEGAGPTRGGIQTLPIKVKRLRLNQIQPFVVRFALAYRERSFSLHREEGLEQSWSGALGLVCPAAPEEENRSASTY